jgi:hypothetical protein
MSSTTPGTTPTTQPIPANPTTSYTFIVCLPAGTDPQFLGALAHARLAAGGYAATGQVNYFPTLTRARRFSRPQMTVTSGAPIGQLDLDGMRRAAANAAAFTWQRWNYVVAGTPIAKPFWVFVDKHLADQRRYPLAQAKADYLNQPRITAMRAFNALPNNGGELPTGELEAFQAGANTYVNIGQLAAVVADGVAALDGSFLTPASTRLADQLTYLHDANRHLARLPAAQPIAAVAVTPAAQP